VSGERRTRASRLAGLTKIEAYVHELLSDKNMGEWALIENIQRVDLNPIEIAQSYQQLIDNHSYTHEDLSKSVGKSRSVITNALRLLKLPESVKTWIQEGKLSSTAARSLLSPEISDPEKAAREIMEKGLNVREAEKMSNKISMDPNLSTFVNKLQEHLGTKIQLQSSKKDYSQGKIIIDYYSFEDLTRLQELMAKA
jgi:ParB family chromosome partitioning protein